MFADGGWRPASRSARDPTPVDNHVEVELHHEWQVVEENGAVEAERLPNDARCVAHREGDRARPAKSRRGRLSEHLRRYCGLRAARPGRRRGAIAAGQARPELDSPSSDPLDGCHRVRSDAK
jgi:hypothetical protein